MDIAINQIAVIGLGYIGLPTAALLANHNIPVLGVDINQNLITDIYTLNFDFKEPILNDLISKAIKNQNLTVTNKVGQSDVYILVVPTPFKGNFEPDISSVINATYSVLPFLKKGDIFILESTSPVGTTEKLRDLIFSRRPELVDEIFIAYCPERVIPGNIFHELVHNDRVIGGINEISSEKVISFYRKFVKGNLYATDSKTAEMCKLTENSARDVQIAFANELSIICEKAGINVWELINLANKHPRVNILQPGCGVGGHCIAVDPYFIVSEYPLEARLINKAREINTYKSFWTFEKIKNAQLEFYLKYNKIPKIAIFGLTFKPNINDSRESPAKFIAEKLFYENSGINNLYFVEPNLKECGSLKLTPVEVAIDNSDILVFLVAHNEFKNLKIANKIILDFCNVNS